MINKLILLAIVSSISFSESNNIKDFKFTKISSVDKSIPDIAKGDFEKTEEYCNRLIKVTPIKSFASKIEYEPDISYDADNELLEIKFYDFVPEDRIVEIEGKDTRLSFLPIINKTKLVKRFKAKTAMNYEFTVSSFFHTITGIVMPENYTRVVTITSLLNIEIPVKPKEAKALINDIGFAVYYRNIIYNCKNKFIDFKKSEDPTIDDPTMTVVMFNFIFCDSVDFYTYKKSTGEILDHSIIARPESVTPTTPTR